MSLLLGGSFNLGLILPTAHCPAIRRASTQLVGMAAPPATLCALGHNSPPVVLGGFQGSPQACLNGAHFKTQGGVICICSRTFSVQPAVSSPASAGSLPLPLPLSPDGHGAAPRLAVFVPGPSGTTVFPPALPEVLCLERSCSPALPRLLVTSGGRMNPVPSLG